MTAPTRGEIIQETMRAAVKALDGFIHVEFNGENFWLPSATVQTMTHCIHLGPDGLLRIAVETGHLEWVAQRLLPGGTFIDVGAATGAFCLPLAKRFGRDVAIKAFEPNATTRALLKATIARNALPWIKVLPYACSDRRGYATFHEYPNDDESPWAPEGSTLGKPFPHLQGVKAVTVMVTTLDDQFAWFFSRRIKNAVVKIDVEGYEAKVLAGAQRFLARSRPALAIDIHPNPFGTGTTEADVRTALEPLGYRCEMLAHVLTAAID